MVTIPNKHKVNKIIENLANLLQLKNKTFVILAVCLGYVGFLFLHKAILELCQSHHWDPTGSWSPLRLSTPISQIGQVASSGKNSWFFFFHLWMMEATVFIGTFNVPESFSLPLPRTIQSQRSTDLDFMQLYILSDMKIMHFRLCTAEFPHDTPHFCLKLKIVSHLPLYSLIFCVP